MGVTARSHVLGDPGDLGAPPGSQPWAIAMRLELLNTFQRRDDAENHLQRTRDWFVTHEGWRLLKDRRGYHFSSWEAFCVAKPPYGLGTSAEHLDAEVERRALREKPGRPKNGEIVRDGQFTSRDGHDYWLARLEKEHYDDLAAQVRSGKLKAKTAARQAGILKPKTPLEELQYWWRKANPAERLTFRQALETETTEAEAKKVRT